MIVKGAMVGVSDRQENSETTNFASSFTYMFAVCKFERVDRLNFDVTLVFFARSRLAHRTENFTHHLISRWGIKYL